MHFMKIATWNVAYGVSPSKNTRILEQMALVDADIWVLTETHDDLRPPTAGEWHSVSSSSRPREARAVREGSRWVTIWSRLPIVDTLVPSHDPVRTSAGVIVTPLGNLLVFGTVLPWYQDVGRSVAEEFTSQSEDWKSMLRWHECISACVAGDFNVNLGGPHYYGRGDDKDAVRSVLADQDLVALTAFELTGPVQHVEFGLIDHIAVSQALSEQAQPAQVWQRENKEGEAMSDHCGVAVEFRSDNE